MEPALFVFGTLRDAALREAVAGGPLAGRAAALPGQAVARALSPEGALQPFPILTPRPGAAAEGLLLAPDPGQMARLDAYEAMFRYRPEPVEVLTAEGPVQALVYRAEGEAWAPGPDWDLGEWARDWGELRRRAAAEVMALWPRPGLAAMAARYPMIEIAAASALRAQGVAPAASLRRAARPEDAQTTVTRRPYAWFFGVQEDEIRFRRFDGRLSDPVRRAGFVMGDAVTVLPYDPIRDRVLLVEQFRYGAWLRGDPNPWSLEPIAGRIDAAETPEAAARREAIEEAGLEMGELLFLGRYYPSPGAVTEYLYSYVALADLPDSAAGLGGLDAEAEDIRAHVVGFERLMALVAASEVENGPLLLTAWWLAAQRDRLRAEYG